MCGIVGVIPVNRTDLEVDDKTRRLVSLYLHNEILRETKARGEDATGLALAFGPDQTNAESKPFWYVVKQPVVSDDFFLNDGSDPKYSGQDPEATITRVMEVASLIDNRKFYHVIGHARKKTLGSEYNPLNNHPIIVGNIIGIHNGGVKNHLLIYNKHKEMTPAGEVDSEAIIQLLAKNANDRALGEDDIHYVTQRIDGPHAVIAYNREYPTKLIYFRDKERPIEFAYIRELGLAVLHSERPFIKTAMLSYNRLRLSLRRDLPELTLEWRHVSPGEGGVIDIEKEVSADDKIDDIFPIVKCKSLLAEYDKDYKPPTKTDTKTTTHVQTQTTYNTHVQQTKTEEPKITEAELTDFSDYDSDTGNSNGEETKVIAEANILDDTDEGEPSTETEEVNSDDLEDDDDDSNSIASAYSNEELRKKGLDLALDSDYRKDETLSINVYKGKYATLFSVPDIGEDEATEIMNNLYPEIFSEGYEAGFRTGAEAQAEIDEDRDADDSAEDIQELSILNASLENENEQLKITQNQLIGRIKQDREKMSLAASYIANMKSALMAAMITSNLAEINKSGTMSFSKQLEDFVNSQPGFERTDLDVVFKIFKDQDVAAIKEAINERAKKVTTNNQ